MRALKTLSFVLLVLLPFSLAEAACITERCLEFRKLLKLQIRKEMDQYCYWDLKTRATGHDYEALSKEVLGRLDDSMDFMQFYNLSRNWSAEFRDGHVNYMMETGPEKIQLASAEVRFELLAPDSDRETLIISQAGAGTGLKAGDIVVQIGSLTPDQAIARAIHVQSASTMRMKRFTAARRLVEVLAPTEGLDDSLSIVVQRPGDGSGKQLKATLPLTWDTFPLDDYPYYNDPLDHRFLEGNIGYLKIRRFRDTELPLMYAMDELSTADALILDLRGNGGGDQSGNVVLSKLITEEINRYSTRARVSKDLLESRPEWKDFVIGGKEFTEWRENRVQPSEGPSFAGKPVIALIGPDCFSACDTFVAALKSHQLATLIGYGTGGGTGTPLVQSLPNGHKFRYSVIQGRTAEGTMIEGAGTLPDIEYVATPEERARGYDGALALAVKTITGQAPKAANYESRQSLRVNPTAQEHQQSRLTQDCNVIFH